MLTLAKPKILHNLTRSISTCNVAFNKYASRESKFLSKMMRGERGKKKWYRNSDDISPSAHVIKKGSPPQNSRRTAVLNKLFTKHITDLLATGEVGLQIVGKGLDISRVCVTPDFHQVNVFWMAKDGDEHDDMLEKLLLEVERPLRHELSQLRVIGVVPPIKFFKDKKYVKIIEIDRRLQNADFGEDFVPSDPTFKISTNPVFNVTLPDDVWTDIRQLENESSNSEMLDNEETLPEMRNDILGLDYSSILVKVTNSMDKSKAAAYNRSLNISALGDASNVKSTTVTRYLSCQERKEAFTEFLRKRQYEEKRKRKSKLYDSDDEYHLNNDNILEEEDVDADNELDLDNWYKRYDHERM